MLDLNDATRSAAFATEIEAVVTVLLPGQQMF